MSTPVQVLRDARALLSDEARWRKGPQDGTPRLCAIDAIALAAGFDGSGRKIVAADWQVYEEARAALRQAVRTDSIPEWNDDPERDHAEIIAGFDAGIKVAESAS